jgi:hypothetical protein
VFLKISESKIKNRKTPEITAVVIAIVFLKRCKRIRIASLLEIRGMKALYIYYITK